MSLIVKVQPSDTRLPRLQFSYTREEPPKITAKKPGQGIYNPSGKRLYTLKEAARYLGRSESSMRELVWDGKIPAVRAKGTRKIFLDVVDLTEYIDRNKSIYR